MTSKHYTNDRQSRNRLIKQIGIGKPVDRFYIDRGHKDGTEIHVITSTALILIYNQRTHRFITALIARPAQIERYYINDSFKAMPEDVYRLAVEHIKLGYNQM